MIELGSILYKLGQFSRYGRFRINVHEVYQHFVELKIARYYPDSAIELT